MQLCQEYNVAIYCRLSSEDRNVEVSSSIKTQEESLTDYVNKQGWNIYKIYSDDGVSGTVFDRPSFNEMIEDIKKKRVNLVITKDLSRLGRNYIQSGYYLEQFFPENNVRYIALNDNYDSLDSNDEFIPFKNIMNEFYAKDISKKIRFAYNTKVANGTVIPTSVPYGYIKENKKIRVDDNVKGIIIRIFNEYIENGSPKMIADGLNEDGFLIPSLYNVQNGIRKASFSSKDGKWGPWTINSIIKEEAYKGVFVAKRTYNVSFKDKKRRKNDEANYVRVKGIYEPIVSEEIWDKANSILKAQTHNPYSALVNKYTDIVYCGHCGVKMKLIRRDFKDGSYEFQYMCKNYKNNDSGHTVKMKELDNAVRSQLLILKENILSDRESFLRKIEEYLEKHKAPKKNYDEQILKLCERDKQLDQLSEKVIEKNLNGLIASDTADSILKKYKDEKKDIQAKLQIYKNKESETQEVDLESSAKVLIQFLELFDETMEIDRELIVSIVSKIRIKTEPIDGKWNRKFIDVEFLGLPNEVIGVVADGDN